MNSTPVEILRAALVRAETGEITGVAIATTHADLCTGSTWGMDSATLAELIGSVAILSSRLIAETREDS